MSTLKKKRNENNNKIINNNFLLILVLYIRSVLWITFLINNMFMIMGTISFYKLNKLRSICMC
jgi:hypothetical protein